jgi:hypothetical protein
VSDTPWAAGTVAGGCQTRHGQQVRWQAGVRHAMGSRYGGRRVSDTPWAAGTAAGGCQTRHGQQVQWVAGGVPLPEAEGACEGSGR